ncbi:MAG TPA: HNH endonuclease [Marmoricola sp.]|nr:HNH endonuclease [Marmoricola sp.]
MNSGTKTTDATGILAVARGARAAANAAEAQVLASAVEWAHLHTVNDLDDAATWWSGTKAMGQDTGIPIAGEGAPLVSEFAVLEFATALGLTADSGRNLVGLALELAHRLPRVWARVQAGSLAPWRAKRIAENTLHLSAVAASFVDAQVAPFAHQTGPAQTQRLVDEAIARFMPQVAAEQRERSAEQRYFTIDHDQVSFAGTSRVHGEMDLADALDLEDAIRRGAEQLATLGNTESLDVRRSLAVGMLARGEQALEFDDFADGGFEARCARTSTTGRAAGREVVLYAHLSADDLTSGDPDAPAWVENAGGQLLTAAQVAAWCRRADTAKVTVRPVLDLNESIICTGYQPSDRLAEQIRQRDHECVFPWCHRPARACQLDHIVPWEQGGPTTTSNLACLCVKHHRLKTHSRWTYSMLAPGVFLWRDPYGHRWRTDRHGTTDLSPPDQ